MVEEWDSLAHINLIIALEQEFDVKFKTTVVNNFKNVAELVVMLQAKMA